MFDLHLFKRKLYLVLSALITIPFLWMVILSPRFVFHSFGKFCVAYLASWLVMILVARWWVRACVGPFHALERVMTEFAAHRGQKKVLWRVSEEFAPLARFIHEMNERIGEQMRSLEKDRVQHRAILSALVESVVAMDDEKRIVFVNTAAEKLFGIRLEDVQGRTFVEAIRHSDLHDLASRVPHGGAIEKEMILLSGDAERTLAVHALPVKYETAFPGVLLALHDVTELRKLERLRQEFVANVTHELKTPLTSIKGFVETLLMGAYQNPTDCKEFLETIQYQSERLSRLIDDILDLAAIENKRMAYRFQPVDVRGLVERLRLGLEPQMQAKGIRFENQLPIELAPVWADPERLAQILMNLFENAIKYNIPQGWVRISGKVHDRVVELSVSDSGVGIPEDAVSRIFERFYRADPSRNQDIPGTGLGLSIVKHLVEAHNGKISVDSRPNEGTCFTLQLPQG